MPCEICEKPATHSIEGVSLCYGHYIDAGIAQTEAFENWMRLQNKVDELG